MGDIVVCQECKHRVPPMCSIGRSYCEKLKVYIYDDIYEAHCIHGEREGRGKMTKQIKWALDVLNSGAWRDNIPDDVSDADINPLYDAITTVNGTLERLTYCSECKYFMQRGSIFGYCGRYNCRKLVFDFCSVGEVEEQE